MNPEQWQSLIQRVLAILLGPGSYLVLKGILPEDLANQLIPVLVPLIMAGGGALLLRLGYNAHSPAAVVAVVNSASVPGVKAVSANAPAQPVQVDPKSGAVTPVTTP